MPSVYNQVFPLKGEEGAAKGVCLHNGGNAQYRRHANKERYYDHIIRAIVDTGSADTMIEEMTTLIKRMTVDELHIVGDIFDRGPHADVILDHLMTHHHVDVQWGNHDVLWMGAAGRSPVCVATAVKNCVQ